MILIRFLGLAGLMTYTSPPTPLQRRGASSPLLEGLGEVFAMMSKNNLVNLFNLNKIVVQTKIVNNKIVK